MKLHALFLFVLFIVINRGSTEELSVHKIMQKNLFGDVSGIVKAYRLDNSLTYTGAKDNSKLLSHEGIVIASPSFEERTEYRDVETSFTFANKELGIGSVRGRGKADQWMEHRSRGFILPSNHPRHNASNCVAVTRQAGEQPVTIYDQWKGLTEPFYMYKFKKGIVDHTGMVALKEGYVQFLSHCETIAPLKGRQFFAAIKESFGKLKGSFKNEREFQWNDLFSDQKFNRSQTASFESLREPIVDRVLVISSIWDYNYHHFIHDCIARLIRLMPFLLEYEDIYIHVREMEKKNNKMVRRTKGMPLREKILELLGINPNRIIARSIRAKEIYLTREIGCNFALQHALELRLLANVFTRRAFEYSGGKCKSLLQPGEKNLIVMERECHPTLRIWRCLNATNFPIYKRKVLRQFPSYHVYSTAQFPHMYDKNLTLTLACDILEYTKASMILGKHGAGFTNMIFMKPGGLVVELVGEFDGRMLPLCGYHGPLAGIFGLHHYINYYDFFSGADVHIDQMIQQCAFFANFVAANNELQTPQNVRN